MPGCSHTAGTPRPFASSNTFCVIFGGVIIETAVVDGEGRAERDGTAGWAAERAVMVAAVGLMGVTGRDWLRYHAKTVA